MRRDLDRLRFIEERLNEYYGGEIGFWIPSETEDYGLDMRASGFTGGKAKVVPFEAKTVKAKFDRRYLTEVAGRNGKCRYCDSAATFEEMESDTTPRPDWLTGATPVHVINSTDRKGRPEGSKWATMLEQGAGLVWLTKRGILLYSPEDFKRAILGHFWILCGHTSEFRDRGLRWERKAAVDMNKYTVRIDCEVPEDLLR